MDRSYRMDSGIAEGGEVQTSSIRRIEANRRNALLSTGPRTDAGKAIVARNAMVHGLRAQQVLIEGESVEEFEAFRQAMAEYYEPAGVLECELVENVVVALWRLKRAARIEVEILEHFSQPERAKADKLPFVMIIRKTYTGSPVEIDEPQEQPETKPEPEPAMPRKSLGEAVKAALEGTGVLGKFIRYEAHISKTLYASIRELERIQEKRKRENVINRDIELQSSEVAEELSSGGGIYRDGQDDATTDFTDATDCRLMHKDLQDTQDQATEGAEDTENHRIHRERQDTQDFATEDTEVAENHHIHSDAQDGQDERVLRDV
jgi:hypothetical protein